MQMRQIVSLGIGQAGIQLANQTWQLFSLEHSIHPQREVNILGETFHTYFTQNRQGKYAARSVFMDLEPTVIDQIRTGHNRYLYNTQNLVSGKEDAASNFARGRYTVGKEMIDICLQTIRKQTEKCEELQGFLVYSSLGGGTGSGFGSLLQQRLSVYYGKKIKIGFNIYPSPQLATSCVQPYNAVLANHTLFEHQDVSVVFDNAKLYDICHRNLDIEVPQYDNLNKMVAHVISSITASSRFRGCLHVDLNEIRTDLVPYPTLHFMLTSYSPLVRPQKAYFQKVSTALITNSIFEQANVMAKCDPRLGKYLACCLSYRGDTLPKDIGAAICHIKTKRTIQFVDWCPTGFRLGITYEPSVPLPNDTIANLQKSCCMISNSSAILSVFQRLAHKFDSMIAKRAFVHWYTGEGMEEEQFHEARQNLAILQKDYEEACLETQEGEEQG